MNIEKVLKALARGISENSPAIFTGLGIAGFFATIAMTAKATPVVIGVHELAEKDREDVRTIALIEDREPDKSEIRDTYICEAKTLAPVVVPVVVAGTTTLGCFLAANKIQADRRAAVMAAYSLSEKTLSTYQQKVIEKLGEETHQDILDETSKEIARNEVPEGFDNEKYVIPAGMVRVYDNVTGRYFFSSKEKILEAESTINKRLLDETRVPLQEFYYELGLDEHFHVGDAVGWDISNMYMANGNTLNIWFSPMLDDDKNPCLALNYHVLVFDRSV